MCKIVTIKVKIISVFVIFSERFLLYSNKIILGAQFGTVISMPISGLLSGSAAGWPSVFYVFGAVGTAWCIAFLFLIYEDPEANKKMNPQERKYIMNSLWGAEADQSVSQFKFYLKYSFYITSSLPPFCVLTYAIDLLVKIIYLFNPS